MSELENLKKENDNMKVIISGFEKVLKLNQEELKNSSEIIKMYESIVEFSGNELKNVKEINEANQKVSSLSREELIQSLEKIKILEEENKRLRAQSEKIN